MGMEKKLQTAVVQGYIEGANDTNAIWEEICKHVPGIGPKLQKRLIETARGMAAEKIDSRKKNRKVIFSPADVAKAMTKQK